MANVSMHVVDIGEGKWQDIWVSKSDLVEFLRCKYRVYVAYARGISIDTLKDSEVIRAIIERGRQFEGSVIARMPLEPLKEEETVESFIGERVIVRTMQLIQNHEFGLRGFVDLINMARGKLYPIEIKSHKQVEWSDKLELAFYWKLLEPWRRGKPKPKGYILLNTGEIAQVNLGKPVFDSLERLLEQVRLVKRNGTEPIISSECKFCSLRDECHSLAFEKGGLSLIFGIAWIRTEQLKSLGITNVFDLAEADIPGLHEQWRRRFSPAPGLAEVARMLLQAHSLIRQKPVYFGDKDSLESLELEQPMIILDLEYDPPSFIWLIGLTIVEGERREYHQFFADERVGEEERRILMHLTEILSKKPKHQIITYGPAADMPQLENAWHRQHLSENELKELKARNLDLYTFIVRHFRLPLVSYSLKDIEEYLGFQRKDKGMDGFQALFLYGDYLRERSKAKKLALRERLLRYNKEDLDATYHVLSHLKSLAKESVKVQSLLHHPRGQFFKTYPHKGSYRAK